MCKNFIDAWSIVWDSCGGNLRNDYKSSCGENMVFDFILFNGNAIARAWHNII